MEKIQKCFEAKIKAAADPESRVITATFTTESIDRDDEIMVADGMQYENYLNNHPGLLWCHQDKLLPLGKALDIRRIPMGWEADFEFATEDMNPEAERVFKLYKGGFLKSFSIRFNDLETIYGDKSTPFRRKFVKWELYEISCVNVPANPEAVRTKSAGDGDNEKGVGGEKAGAEFSASNKEKIRKIKSTLKECHDMLHEMVGDEPEECDGEECGKGEMPMDTACPPTEAPPGEEIEIEDDEEIEID